MHQVGLPRAYRSQNQRPLNTNRQIDFAASIRKTRFIRYKTDRKSGLSTNFCARRSAEPSHRELRPVAVIPTDIRVGTDARFEIIGIFPHEIERCGKSVGDVPCWAHSVADHDFILDATLDR